MKNGILEKGKNIPDNKIKRLNLAEFPPLSKLELVYQNIKRPFSRPFILAGKGIASPSAQRSLRVMLSNKKPLTWLFL
jgi:hypothetical protein